MSDGKKLTIKFADNPNVKLYQVADVEWPEYPQYDFTPSIPDIGPDLGDVTFTVHYTQSWPWWIRGPLEFWTSLTGGWRNN